MKSGEELVDYLSGFHESAIVPDVLLIDDLHYYIAQLKVKIYFVGSFGTIIRLNCKNDSIVLMSTLNFKSSKSHSN